jgi:hypothetical protein
MERYLALRVTEAGKIYIRADVLIVRTNVVLTFSNFERKKFFLFSFYFLIFLNFRNYILYNTTEYLLFLFFPSRRRKKYILYIFHIFYPRYDIIWECADKTLCIINYV